MFNSQESFYCRDVCALATQSRLPVVYLIGLLIQMAKAEVEFGECGRSYGAYKCGLVCFM